MNLLVNARMNELSEEEMSRVNGGFLPILIVGALIEISIASPIIVVGSATAQVATGFTIGAAAYAIYDTFFE